MREQIQIAASVLIGKSLWLCRRAGDMAMFHFGERRKVTTHKGEPAEVGEYALHLQCPWRIVNGDEIVMAALDVYKPQIGHEEEDNQDFDWERAGNLLDERARTFFENGTREYAVEGVDAKHAGTLRLTLQGGFWLEICPCDSSKGEHWRLFQPRIDQPHFVVTGAGIGEPPA
jgi:hypothetical protein